MAGDSMFSCPECDKRYRWKPELVGRRVRCKCQHVMQVPDAPMDDAGYDLADDPDASSEAEACPGCGRPLPLGNALCLHCGYNARAEASAGGVAVAPAHAHAHAPAHTAGASFAPTGGAGGARHVRRVAHAGGFFERMSRSWEYVKISYGILWHHKQLLVFPVFSGIAAMLVLASFYLPLAGTDIMAQMDAFLGEDMAVSGLPLHVYLLVFGFYFCSYFVIVFFNTALAACALRVCDGETPTIGYGLSIAMRRLPQIAGWALISATVGLVLKVIENSNEKVGAIIAAVLGTGWTILTFFVIPVLAAEGLGPVDAFKRALGTLRQTWGEALVGNFSLAIISFILSLPLFIVLFAVLAVAFQGGHMVLIVAVIVALVALALLVAVVSSAADMVFRSLLYNYATGRTVPDEVDVDALEAAFGSRAE